MYLLMQLLMNIMIKKREGLILEHQLLVCFDYYGVCTIDKGDGNEGIIVVGDVTVANSYFNACEAVDCDVDVDLLCEEFVYFPD
ncbi:MAG: hypothetical protein EZS28_025792 [Streblomastix strix]|uniref:Uncharacterized protein n=1 Tax=Streblomastix strix TaxID=222440 RepID=A0A5J4V830_9EUKA|nr:MAG: hypothetical protein EZS28_025792 [Streblomastix strix]